MFSSSHSDGEVFFSFRFFLLDLSCSFRALSLSALISLGTSGKTLLHCVWWCVCACVSLIDVAVQKNNRTKVVLLTLSFRKLLGWEGTAKNISLHLNVFYLAPL